MDSLIDKLHREMAQNIAFREEKGIPNKQMGKWLQWVDTIIEQQIEQNANAQKTAREYHRIDERLFKIEKFLKLIGMDIKTIDRIPIEWYESLDQFAEIKCWNNPNQAWLSAAQWQCARMEKIHIPKILERVHEYQNAK